MANEKLVQTDVDKLLSLIEEKKQFSMEEAAKAVNLPIKTVESLATLLEEENLLHITYKFTTPFLNYGPPKNVLGDKKSSEKKGISEELTITKETAGAKKAEPAIPKSEIRETKEKMELPSPTIGKPGEEHAADESKPKLALPEDLEQLVALANEYVSKGDLETARDIFLEIKRRKTNLPKEYLDRERKLKDGLVRLNELLILGVDRALTSDFGKKQEEMNNVFTTANTLIKNGAIETLDNLKKVEDAYLKLKQLYLTLPDGFIDRRVILQTQLLNLYKTVISSKKRLFTQEFTTKSKQIVALMGQVVAKLNANDLENAGKIMDQVNVLYATLPEGFLKEKTQLQHQILEIYQRLILSKENMYAHEITTGVMSVNDLIKQVYVHLEKNDIAKAREMFVKVTDMYATLPQGFLETKAELESKMLDLHHLLSLKMNKALMDDTKRRVNEINLMFQTAQTYLLNKQYDLARELYLEILALYNSIPQGYPELAQVQTKVIHLYKQLMPYMVEIPTEKDQNTQHKYDELLKLLVQIHEHIKKGEFERIKPKYLMAYKLYHDLPLGFLDKRTDLYREIYKIYHELRLYTDVNKLAEYANAQDYHHLEEALNPINAAYNKLVNQYPEDIELFRYIWQRYLIYLNLLKDHVQERGATGREVRQRIETVAKTPPMSAQVPPVARQQTPSSPRMPVPQMAAPKPQPAPMAMAPITTASAAFSAKTPSSIPTAPQRAASSLVKQAASSSLSSPATPVSTASSSTKPSSKQPSLALDVPHLSSLLKQPSSSKPRLSMSRFTALFKRRVKAAQEQQQARQASAPSSLKKAAPPSPVSRASLQQSIQQAAFPKPAVTMPSSPSPATASTLTILSPSPTAMPASKTQPSFPLPPVQSLPPVPEKFSSSSSSSQTMPKPEQKTESSLPPLPPPPLPSFSPSPVSSSPQLSKSPDIEDELMADVPDIRSPTSPQKLSFAERMKQKFGK